MEFDKDQKKSNYTFFGENRKELGRHIAEK
jgi:hypothetical protein